MMRDTIRRTMLAACLGAAVFAGAQSPTTTTILTRDTAGTVMPATVFFRGQTAGVQLRNTAGLKLGSDRYVLTGLVDTSGYSSAVQQRYQAYLITEVPLHFGSHTLPPGAYGFGFIADNRFLCMDLGGHDLFTITDAHDDALRRPTPLQVLSDGSQTGSYRLYAGRSYVSFRPDTATP